MIILYRYGRFVFKDLWQAWIAIIILLTFAISSLCFHLSLLFVAFPILLAIVWTIKVILPFKEKFSINDNCDIIILEKEEQIIEIPTNATLIVSYVDISPPFATRMSGRNVTHILNNKYFITILKSDSIDDLIRRLHKDNVPKFKYYSSIIEVLFDGNELIYSFVGEKDIIEKITYQRNCDIIIPESLLERVDFDLKALKAKTVYVDKGF